MNLVESNYSIIDTLIKKGDIREAIKLLQSEQSQELLRPIQKAELFRRVGDYASALMALRSEIFEQGDLKSKIKDENLLEYSMNLVQHGLMKQSKELMKRVQKKTYSWFQLAGFIGLKELDYQSSLNAFKSALASKEATDYQKLVASVNIANAYLGVFDFEAAIHAAEHALKKTDPDQHGFLIRYLKHIQSQAYAFLNDRESYLKCTLLVFKSFEMNSKGEKVSSDFFEFCRGRFIAECVLNLKHEFSKHALLRMAESLHEYHAFNEIEIMSELKKRSSTLLKANSMNSSGCYLSQRARILMLLDGDDSSESTHVVQDRFFWKGHLAFQKSNFDFSVNRQYGDLKVGQLPHRILQLFLKNPWRRFTVFEVYEEVFPDRKYFNPTQSPNLIHQGIKRLNTILRNTEIPIQITHHFDRYELTANGHFSANFDLESAEWSAFRQQCRELFKDRFFRCEEMATLLHITPRQIQKLMKQNNNLFEKKRIGRNIYYKVQDSIVGKMAASPT